MKTAFFCVVCSLQSDSVKTDDYFQVWSKKLQYEVDQLDIQKMPDHPPWRYVFYKNYTEDNYGKHIENLNDSMIGKLEQLNPQQNEIACAKKNGLNFTVICLLGPQ